MYVEGIARESGAGHLQSGAKQTSWERARVLDRVKTEEISGYMEEAGKFGNC